MMKTLYYRDNTDLTFKPVKISHYVYTTLLIIFITSSFSFTSAIKFNSFIEKIPVIIRTNEQEFNEENLRKEIKRMNIKFEEVVVAQYKLETGNGISPVFKQNNNLFGMKISYLRPSTAIGNNLNHAVYKNWQESLIDLGFWQIQNAKDIRTEEEYLQLLDAIYSESSNYSQQLKKLMKK